MNYAQRLVDEELAIKGGIGDVKVSTVRVHFEVSTFTLNIEGDKLISYS